MLSQALNENLKNSLETALINKAVVSDEHYRPRLLINDSRQGIKILTTIEDELKQCKEFAISVAFVNMSGITPLLPVFKELENKRIKGKILTTDYLNFTDPKALKKLNEFSNLEIKMYRTGSSNEGFHTKGYIFKKDQIYDIIVGSSNLTQSALTKNKEWNIKLVARTEGEYASKVVQEFDNLWNSKLSKKFDEFIDDYTILYQATKKQREIARQKEIVSIEQYSLTPNAMQVDFIKNIKLLLNKGEKKALLVSATGTGKTYASAFAMREIGIKKLLFIVHREQIAIQAEKSFQMVFGNNIKTGILSGSSKEYDADFIFATKDTFTQEEIYKKYPKDYFDAIIIDEVHRLGENTTYQRLLDYFIPNKICLGMTASPERTDGYDIYSVFNHNIACEIRLKQALEEDMLCPFHYFGITEFLSNETDDNGNYIEHDLNDFRLLVSKPRIDYMIKQLEFYGYSGDRAKGIIFCSRIDEANELSKEFNKRGFKTEALTGDNNDPRVREDFIDRLVSDEREDYLEYIITVNVFNEGVDIPEINQIVMLRPTESPIIFVQQLGRGLRKNSSKEYVVILDFIGNYQNNFMIPIALSGDRSYNKDNTRKFIQQDSKTIPGSSTIHFDEISKNRIYKAIDNANFSDLSLIKKNYINLKNKIGRIPSLIDFEEHGEMDLLRIVEHYSLGSYYKFLKKYEPDYTIELNELETIFIEYISKKILNGKRIHEVEMIDCLMKNETNVKDKFINIMKVGYNIDLSELEINSTVNMLDNSFCVSSDKIKYSECIFLEKTKDSLNISKEFKKSIENGNFRTMVEELLDFARTRYNSKYKYRYKNTDLVLYEKYSYEDVCRLLNWGKNIIPQNIGGYKYDELTNTYPVFINYVKDENINDTIKYADRLLSRSELISISTSNRKISSNDVQGLINADKNNTKVELFIRKNKDDVGAKEFYYLGRLHPNGKCLEFTMPNTNSKAVEIGWDIETPIANHLYEYFIN